MNFLRTTLTLLAAAAPAYAAPQSAGAHDHDHDSQSSHSWSFVVHDGSGECKVECRDGRVTAFLNGEEVPAERIQQHGGRVVILNADGQEARVIAVPSEGGAGNQAFRLLHPSGAGQWGDAHARALTMFGQAQAGQDGAGQWLTGAVTGAGGKRPRIGVSMGTLDEALAAQIGVKPEEAIILTEVESALPAAEAGVQKFDVVVAIDGQSPATEESLRSAVAGKQEGETVTLKIVRRGEHLEIPVRVRMVEDANAFVTTVPQFGGAINLEPQVWRGLFSGEEREKAMAEYDKALESLREAQGRMREQLREHALNGDYHRAVEEAMKQLEESRLQLRDSLGRNQGRLRLHGGNDDVYLFSTPQPSQGVHPPAERGVEDRIRGLEERLARIESMLERLTDR